MGSFACWHLVDEEMGCRVGFVYLDLYFEHECIDTCVLSGLAQCSASDYQCRIDYLLV